MERNMDGKKLKESCHRWETAFHSIHSICSIFLLACYSADQGAENKQIRQGLSLAIFSFHTKSILCVIKLCLKCASTIFCTDSVVPLISLAQLFFKYAQLRGVVHTSHLRFPPAKLRLLMR